MPRGWGRGWCWMFLYPYLAQGQWPTIQVGNTRIPFIPGTGMGWLLWYSILAGQQPRIQPQLPQITTQVTTREDELEYLKRMKEELERKIREIEERIKQLEGQ